MSERAAAIIQFDNQHSDGIVTRLGFGRDWRASRINMGDSWTADIQEPHGWYTDEDIEFISDIGCIAPRGHISTTRDMGLYSGYYRWDGDVLHLISDISAIPADVQSEYVYFSNPSSLPNVPTPYYTDAVVNSGIWTTTTIPVSRKNLVSNMGMLQLIKKTTESSVYSHIGQIESPYAALKNSRITIGVPTPVVASGYQYGGGILIEWPADRDNNEYLQCGVFLPLTDRGFSDEENLIWGNLISPFGNNIQHALLLAKPFFEDAYVIIHNYSTNPLAAIATNGGIVDVDCEWVDDYFVLTISDSNGENFQRAFKPRDGIFQSAANRYIKWTQPTSQRKIRITAVGGSVSVAWHHMVYPTNIRIRPTTFNWVPEQVEYTPQYKIVTHDGLAVGGDDVEVENYIGPDGRVHDDSSRPIVKITQSATDYYKTRSAFYRVNEYRPATIASGTSTPITTLDNENLRLVSLSGQMDDGYQNHVVNFDIESFYGTVPDIRANLKTSLSVSIDGGQTYVQHFVGYLTGEYKKTIDASANQHVVYTLTAADGIQARLNNKRILWMCSLDGWTLNDAVNLILTNAGVPQSLISVDSSIANLIIPESQQRSNPRFVYEPDRAVVDVLNDIVNALSSTYRKIMWGVDVDGIYKFRLADEYIHGTSEIAMIMDRDTLNDDDVIFSVERIRNYQNYATVYYAIGGSGWNSNSRILIDMDAIMGDDGSYDDFYIGDVWTIVDHINTEHGVIQHVYNMRDEARADVHRINIELHNNVVLSPGDYIQIEIDDIDIASGSVYKIVNKNYEIDNNTGLYIQRLEATRVYDGGE